MRDYCLPHCLRRLQQRGIRFEALDAVISFGKEITHGGRTLYLATRQACDAMLEQGNIPLDIVERARGKYAVIENGRVVTVAPICRRIKRD